MMSHCYCNIVHSSGRVYNGRLVDPFFFKLSQVLSVVWLLSIAILFCKYFFSFFVCWLNVQSVCTVARSFELAVMKPTSLVSHSKTNSVQLFPRRNVVAEGNLKWSYLLNIAASHNNVCRSPLLAGCMMSWALISSDPPVFCWESRFVNSSTRRWFDPGIKSCFISQFDFPETSCNENTVRPWEDITMRRLQMSKGLRHESLWHSGSVSRLQAWGSRQKPRAKLRFLHIPFLPSPTVFFIVISCNVLNVSK